MKDYLKKFSSIFHSPGIAATVCWSKCVHLRVFLICVLTVVATICSLGFTIATKELVDGAVSSNMDAIRCFGILLGVLILARHLLNAAIALLRVKAAADLQKSLQGMMVRELLSKEYPGIKGYHSGELVNRVFSDVSVIKNGVMNILPHCVGIVVSFVGAAAILISMDWRFVIFMIAGGVLGLILVLLFRNPMKQQHKRMQESEGALHATMQETLENIRLIKASVSEERSSGRIAQEQEALATQQVRQGIFSFCMNSSMGLIFDLSWLFCMIWGCVNIYHGNLTYGSLAAMIQLIGRIQGPIANAVSIASEVYGVTSSAERLLEEVIQHHGRHAKRLSEPVCDLARALVVPVLRLVILHAAALNRPAEEVPVCHHVRANAHNAELPDGAVNVALCQIVQHVRQALFREVFVEFVECVRVSACCAFHRGLQQRGQHRQLARLRDRKVLAVANRNTPEVVLRVVGKLLVIFLVLFVPVVQRIERCCQNCRNSHPANRPVSRRSRSRLSGFCILRGDPSRKLVQALYAGVEERNHLVQIA